MDNVSLIRMEAGKLDDVSCVLSTFIDQYNQCFRFENFEKDNIYERLWTVLFKHLADYQSEKIHELCLKWVRILSRDKVHLEKQINEQRIELLLRFAALKGPDIDKVGPRKDFTVTVEALKCLCNLTYNSQKVQSICCSNGTLDGIIRRLRMHPDANLPQPVKYFDVEFLFLLSAFNVDIRFHLREKLHALTYLMEALDFILKEGGGYSQNNQLRYFPALDQSAVELSCEILKVLFNLTVKILPVGNDEDDKRADRLLTILRELLLSSTSSHMEEVLCRHIVNLLANMPVSSYELLMPQEEAEYNGEALDVIINFLDNKLSSSEGNSYDVLSPVLIVLTEASRAHKILRKHIRNRILPPLRSVKSKPEEGDEIRNKLCRLLTGVNTKLRNLVAELLFVLCKENVSRMIKYTGFGNAAGMFASRGLLREAVGDRDCSSDSEDSETEEYREIKNKINPITGGIDSPRSKILMTKEEAEYEVMKLVNSLDKLQREGIVQPCKIGPDGKPQPVEHILQLKEEVPKQQL